MLPKTFEECRLANLNPKRVIAEAVEVALHGEPLPDLAPLLRDLLTTETVPIAETRRAIRVVASLRALGIRVPGLESALVIGFDRILQGLAASEALLLQWFELVSEVNEATMAVLHRATLAVDSPDRLDAWATNRTAALILLASPIWAPRLTVGEVARLQLLASDDIEDRWKGMLDAGGFRIVPEQIAAWVVSDTPEARWRAMEGRRNARGRPVRILKLFPDDAVEEPVPRRPVAPVPVIEPSAEALAELAQPPHRVLNSGRRCPDCRTTEHVRWFYFCSPPWTWPALCGREFWFSVCMQCRVRLATVRVAMS